MKDFECRENLANKEDVLNYLDFKIGLQERNLEQSEALSDNCIFKHLYLAKENAIIQELKEVRSFIGFSLKNQK